MRYADRPEVECDVEVAAAGARVWELVTDIVLPTRFSPELRRVRWLDGAVGPAVGARFEGYNENRYIGEWRTVCHVLELDRPRAFRWAVLDADGRFGAGPAEPGRPMATWWFELAATADGTLLRHGVRIGPARSGLSLAIDRRPDREVPIVRHRLADLRSAIEATLDGVRRLAEQPQRRT